MMAWVVIMVAPAVAGLDLMVGLTPRASSLFNSAGKPDWYLRMHSNEDAVTHSERNDDHTRCNIRKNLCRKCSNTNKF